MAQTKTVPLWEKMNLLNVQIFKYLLIKICRGGKEYGNSSLYTGRP